MGWTLAWMTGIGIVRLRAPGREHRTTTLAIELVVHGLPEKFQRHVSSSLSLFLCPQDSSGRGCLSFWCSRCTKEPTFGRRHLMMYVLYIKTMTPQYEAIETNSSSSVCLVYVLLGDRTCCSIDIFLTMISTHLPPHQFSQPAGNWTLPKSQQFCS